MIEVTDEMRQTLSDYRSKHGTMTDNELCSRIIETHEANKPKPEPVGYAWVVNNRVKVIADTELDSGFIPLYTTPPTRKPLSDNELLRIFEKMPSTGMGYYTTFARAIEQAHGIGATND